MAGRPLLFCVPVAALTFYFAAKSGVAVGVDTLLFALALLLALLAGALQWRHVRTVLLLGLTAICALFYFTVFKTEFVRPVRALHDQTQTVTATVARDATVYDDSQRAELKIQPFGKLSRPFQSLCYLPLTDKPLLAGQQIEVMLRFYRAGDAGGFDRETFQAANGSFIAGTFVKQEDSTEPEHFLLLDSKQHPIFALPQRFARYCRAAVLQYLPEREGGLLAALLLGDKTALTNSDDIALRKAGLSHLVAVSGLHVSFLVGFCYVLGGRRMGTVLSVPAILFFIAVAGATPSVVRAGIMYLIAAGGFLLKKQADSLNSLLLALLFLLLQNPYAIFSLSLQLSFAATLGLILCAGKMQRRLTGGAERVPKPLRGLFRAAVGAVSCTVCAMLFTTPILLSAFGYVSVLSLPSNLMVVGVTAVCFIGGFLLCLLSLFFAPAAGMAAIIIRPLLHYMLLVAERVSALPIGLIYWGDGFGLAALSLFLAAVMLFIWRGNRIKWRLVLPCLCCAIGVLNAFGIDYAQTHYRVSYLPSGNGQTILVSRAADELIVIDCNGGTQNAAEQVRDWMQWHSFERIDALVLTAVDIGHARDLPDMLSQLSIDTVYMPDGCKPVKRNRSLLALLDAQNAVSVTPEQAPELALPVSLFPVTDGKLGADIGGHTLILHSPTQKQLAAYLALAPHTAKTVVLSEGNISDVDLLRQALAILQPERLLLQARGKTITRFDGIPVQTTYESGEIYFYYPIKE